MSENTVLQITNISKQFPGVKALDHMRLTLHKGEVAAIAGENGAGKSTLMKILSGIYTPDEGEILLDGKPVAFRTPAEAEAAGISTVHQELSVFPQMSIAENIFVNRQPRTRSGLLDYTELYAKTKEILTAFELGDLSPKALVGSLDIARQQVIEIIRATQFNPRILILDEPTSALTIHDTRLLFRVIRQLREQGTSILYISHRIEEIFEVCDTVTIMRDGAWIATSDVPSITKDQIVHYMVGREVAYNYGKNSSAVGGEVLCVEHLSGKGKVRDVSFSLKSGEVLGIGGLEGSGRTELMEMLFGIRKTVGGNVWINGKKRRIHSPIQAKASKLAYITKDRKKVGLFTRMSIEDNILSGNLERFSPHGIVGFQSVRAEAERCVRSYDIRTTSLQKLVYTLSGGNQQKVMLAMWLLAEPEILLVDEPTRGIDVGTKEYIHKILRDLAKEGKAILMISSDMPELLSASDRILVMCNGAVTGELSGEEATEYQVMQLAVREAAKVQTEAAV